MLVLVLLAATSVKAEGLGAGINASVKADIEVPTGGIKSNANVDSNIGADIRTTSTPGYNRSNDVRERETGNATSAEARARAEARFEARADDPIVASTSDSRVEIKYKLPAKFLGIFSAGLNTTAMVDLEQTGAASGQGNVTVKFPWYRIFFSLDESARADTLQTAISSSIAADSNAGMASSEGKIRTVNIVSSVLKSIRAKIDAEASVNR